ncbi:MAG: DNA repair exonuclease [Candidatus Bathyarchaeota archaeon]|nr:MAG: DNA repair exonuclease [Candidatus Bathyarchaeota archaeon]
MKPFSFVHVADLHLGYAQYNSDARREDFNATFREVVEKTVELKPDFMLIAGDLFQHARPSNITLENAITSFRKLRDAKIPVLTVDGSHDSAPNMITGTILNPLDSAGLVHYLPRHKGACWRNESCYVYGVPNFRTKQRTEEQLPIFLKENQPTPDSSLFNIFLFHMAVDIPRVSHPQMEAEARPELLPESFNYYAAGHVHVPSKSPFKNGLLVYSGCTETVSYEDARVEKGFYYVKASEKGAPKVHRIKLETPRHFIILDEDYTGLTPSKITEKATRFVRKVDEAGAVIIPVIRGVLPAEAGRWEVNLTRIRSAAEKALLVRPLLQLRQTEVPEEVVRSIFESELKDLKTKAFEYFLEIFSERYAREEGEKIAKLAVGLIEPLAKKEEPKVREKLEEFSGEN